MKILNYSKRSKEWVKPYYSKRSDFDKAFMAKAFQMNNKKNTECVILIATDTCTIGIDNPDIKLMVQLDMPLSFHSMIQQLSRKGKENDKAVFVLLTPKLT